MTIAIRDLPRLAPLVRDYFDDYPKVAPFFGGDFRDQAAFERLAERASVRDLPRAAVAEVLAEQNRGYGCGEATLANVRKLADGRACAVVTGQQVGLFSGPLYTIYKALTAIKLAERLGRRSHHAFVPVFWLASDDHDLAEIDHILLLDKDHRLEQIRCPMPGLASPRIPVSGMILPPEIEDCLRRLEDLTRETEFKAGIVSSLRDAYRPGWSMVEAFARWMTGLFASSGLVFIDAAHPALKALGKEVFRREIAEDSPSTQAALETSRKLRQAGYGEQIHLHEHILSVFYAEHERRAVQRTGSGFEIKDPPQAFSKEALLALATDKPSFFSPNVLLRPLLQDALLPTVAYIAGPGEIAYFAQMKGVYERFGLPMPVIYPRASLTLVEKSVARILAKYGLGLADIWSKADLIVSAAVEEGIPESLSAALRLARSNQERDFGALAAEIAALEPTLRNSVDLARGKMDLQWDFLEKKVLAAVKKRNEISVRQLGTAVDTLFPNRILQERVFNIVPYLLKYGPAFMDTLDRAVEIDAFDHRVVEI
jgi:bacillithiol biosynthesis cysteine-adding enzyme BshC